MPKRLLIFFLLLSLACYAFAGYMVKREDFSLVAGTCGILSGIYFLLLRYRKGLSTRQIIAWGLAFRIVLIPAWPALSDDFYRFIWDGLVQQSGVSPYAVIPHQTGLRFTAELASVYPKLNSQHYFSVYPPVSQMIYRLCTIVGGGTVYGSMIALKVFIAGFETGTLLLMARLLGRFGLAQSLIAIYAFNPLVILELCGNIHFEAGMIFFTLLAVWLMLNKKRLPAAAALAGAVCIKLLPLLFIPVFWHHLPRMQFLKFAAATCFFCLVLCLPYFNNMNLVSNFLTSLQLYYGKFEFNGSLYLLLRETGYAITGNNEIYFISKAMLLFSFTGFLWIWLKKKQIFTTLFLLLAAHLLFSATVHPWYLAPLVACTPFINFRFALLWAALAPLSYITYASFPYRENFWLTGIEYGLVACFLFWELRKKNGWVKADLSRNIV